MGSAEQVSATSAADETNGVSALESDTLVEEISIDGRCGVY